MTVLDHLANLIREQGIPARGLVHVGAHKAEELPIYRRMGFAPIVLVEPNPDLAGRLVDTLPDAEVIQAACGAYDGTATLYITENTKLSSLYQPITRPIAGQVEVPVRRLADVIDERVNVAVVDVQGAELDVMAGAPLDRLDLVVMETRIRAKYAGAPLHSDAVGWMARRGWEVAAVWAHDPKGKLNDVAFTPRRR
ncbi:FkbM family methyltransferase [Micromonospora sp. WMMD1102]|uniref:FkbM family methyltransferase n=1 Tax=Micromonospora sp. WMMD1102 TaxID=3016105 RepID=UPI002414F702|nr:FkbM family methyltransferase [Micromonospora sp. WMMD1102]MDG4792012.1 FkbM family methyltransferase [Micromonospora sp. WMMD1102]